MKLMWLHSHLSFWGGGTKFVYQVIEELTKNNTVDLFVQKSSPEILQKFQKICKVDTLSGLSTGDKLFWLNFEKQILKETSLLKNVSKDYDIVISSMFPMNVHANNLEIPHIQYCFEPFAFFWDKFMIKSMPLQKKLFLKLLKQKFGKKDLDSTKKATRILTVNSGTKNWVSKIYERDSIPTLLGVDTKFFKTIIDESLQKKYTDKKIIIHSTDWTPLKRTAWLVDQFIEISSKIDNVQLLITEVKTEGKERDLILKKIKENKLDNIELCGFVAIENLPAYYSLANIGVYTGIGQGASAASLFVLECMACQTPVVRTNDTNEEVEHNKSGFLFDKDDSQGFQKYVCDLLDNTSKQEEFAKFARERIIEKYSWKKVSDIFEKNCLDLVKSKVD